MFESTSELDRREWVDYLSDLIPAFLILASLGLNGLVLAAVTPSDISDSLQSPQVLVGSMSMTSHFSP
jgi:hypothetical protein